MLFGIANSVENVFLYSREGALRYFVTSTMWHLVRTFAEAFGLYLSNSMLRTFML